MANTAQPLPSTFNANPNIAITDDEFKKLAQVDCSSSMKSMCNPGQSGLQTYCIDPKTNMCSEPTTLLWAQNGNNPAIYTCESGNIMLGKCADGDIFGTFLGDTVGDVSTQNLAATAIPSDWLLPETNCSCKNN